MIGAAIGAAAGALGSIIGGASASKNARKARKELEKQGKQNESWFAGKMGEDLTNRADIQAALARGRQSMMDSITKAEGTQAVTGGTEAGVLASRQAAAEAMANATANAAAQVAQEKNAAESQYLATKNNISNQRVNTYNQMAQNNTMAANQAMSAGMGLATADMQAHLDTGGGLFESLFKKKA